MLYWFSVRGSSHSSSIGSVDGGGSGSGSDTVRSSGSSTWKWLCKA